MTADLAAWLLADDGPIAEDEAYARAILNASDAAYSGTWSLMASATLDVGDDVISTGDARLARHVVRWDPARVLAECAAKRAVIAKYDDTTEPYDPDYWGALAECIAILAQPYAGRPGWRDEWAIQDTPTPLR